MKGTENDTWFDVFSESSYIAKPTNQVKKVTTTHPQTIPAGPAYMKLLPNSGTIPVNNDMVENAIARHLKSVFTSNTHNPPISWQIDRVPTFLEYRMKMMLQWHLIVKEKRIASLVKGKTQATVSNSVEMIIVRDKAGSIMRGAGKLKLLAGASALLKQRDSFICVMNRYLRNKTLQIHVPLSLRLARLLWGRRSYRK